MYRNNHYLRNAVTLGTGLTALLLVLRCSVPGRDYSQLGIDGNAGNAGASGSGDDIVLTSGGRGGEAGLGGQGGLGDPGDAGAQGGSGGAPPVPIPCNPVIIDAGADDAGSNDAGTEDDTGDDAGVADDPCECVDGFIRAVDSDGDGDGTRACTVAPGLDCDDGDNAVTHNSCNGCTALTETLGADCLDCGAYACAGPETIVCASKPGAVVVDPDCRCFNALIVARDTDQDGQGTRLCEQNPGSDCNDGNNTFITDVCGGCEQSLPGAPGAACNECGVYTCNINNAMVCAPPAGAASRRCQTATLRQECIGSGFWEDTTCANVCYAGNCQVCTPGTFMCTGASLYKCLESASYGTISWNSWDSCSSAPQCNANLGICTGSLLLPRDENFDVVPLRRPGLPWHELLNTASDSDYG